MMPRIIQWLGNAAFCSITLCKKRFMAEKEDKIAEDNFDPTTEAGALSWVEILSLSVQVGTRIAFGDSIQVSVQKGKLESAGRTMKSIFGLASWRPRRRPF